MRYLGLGITFLFAFLISQEGAAQRARTHSDPVEYCRAAGNVDRPGRLYRGPAVPPWMHRRLNATGEETRVEWRCHNGRVLACVNFGITGPCDGKDTSRVATAAMRRWCREEPNSMIPASVAGHYTIFDWRCRGRQPSIFRQITFL